MILGPQGLTRGGKGVTAFNRIAPLRIKQLEPLTSECVEYLMGVVRDGSIETKHRVTAAKCILEENRWVVDRYVKQPEMEQLTEMQARALLACDPLLGKLAREQHDAAAILAEVNDDEAE